MSEVIEYMIQQLVLPVNDTGTSKFKDGDLIIYDEKNRYFYKTNKENFFAKEQKERQDFILKMQEEYKTFVEKSKKQIEDMEKKYQESITLNKKILDEKIKKLEDYMKNMTNNYNGFLNEFKDTNTKLIEMVEKVIL